MPIKDRKLPTLDPKYILFDDFLKAQSKEKKIAYVGTTRSKGFARLLLVFPEVVTQGVLVRQYNHWYINALYMTDPESNYYFRGLLFNYHKVLYYTEELRRADKHLHKSLVKLHPFSSKY
jgi:hypothetical protein